MYAPDNATLYYTVILIHSVGTTAVQLAYSLGDHLMSDLISKVVAHHDMPFASKLLV